MRTEESQSNIVKLSDIRRERSRALSPYGPVKAGLTTLPGQEIVKVSPLARLSELLNSLENEAENLKYKSFTAYATLATAIEDLRVVVYDIVTSEDGTDE